MCLSPVERRVHQNQLRPRTLHYPETTVAPGNIKGEQTTKRRITGTAS